MVSLVAFPGWCTVPPSISVSRLSSGILLIIVRIAPAILLFSFIISLLEAHIGRVSLLAAIIARRAGTYGKDRMFVVLASGIGCSEGRFSEL